MDNRHSECGGFIPIQGMVLLLFTVYCLDWWKCTKNAMGFHGFYDEQHQK